MLEYADDRPWPGATAWADAVSRRALAAMATAVADLTDFEAACINVTHRGALRAVAVEGTEVQRRLIMDSQVPVAEMEAELALGDALGRFVFVPAERIEPGSAVIDPGAPVPDPGDHGAWHPADLLCSPFRDEETGALIGMLSVDNPRGGRRPERCARLDRYSEMVEVAVRMALDRDQQRERVAMATVARRVAMASSRQVSMDAVVDEASAILVPGFAARGVHLRVFDEETWSVARGAGAVVDDLPREELVRAETITLRAWEAGVVVALDADAPTPARPDPVLGAERAAVQAGLVEAGVGSMLLAPVGGAEACLGWLALGREPGAPPWSTVETETLREIGRDLGRTILNVRAFEREQAAVAELQALDSYKSRLVATLSHELKTPLASVLGNLELLQDQDVTPADTRRSLSAIGRGAHRLVRVVDDLVLLAKVGDAGGHVTRRPVDLAEVTADIVAMTAASAERSAIDVRLDLGPGRAVVLGDTDELDWVVSNLVSNALKYTPPHGHVLVDVRRDGGDVVLTCADDGIGISEADQARLFHEFFRSADPAVQRQPGSGLGLTITDQIVRRHGGRTTVESTVGGGSTFTVRLPAAGDPGDAPPDSAEPGTGTAVSA